MTLLFFYLGLGGLLLVEEAGVFLLPGDISLVGAGVYSAQGGPRLVMCWLVAGASMALGATVLFYGVRRSRRSAHVLPDRVRDLVRRHHSWGVAGARLVPGLRNATVFAAAAADLPESQFLMGLVPAAFAWSGALLLLGWFGGATIHGVLGNLESAPLLKLASASLILAAAVYATLRLRGVHRPDEPPSIS